MTEIVRLFIVGSIIAGIAAISWWLFIASEGVYLGRRVVIWLYDLYAHRYDGVKGYMREYEQLYLAEPIMEAITPHTAPFILDVATGTGRLPLAMARQPEFDGHTIGVDLSRKMLHFATRNIYPYNEQASFVWCPAEQLPFPADTFDVVTCLEALEFMSNPPAVVSELVRVLRPGGLLLVSQRINTKLMPGKTWSSEQIQQVLREAGISEAKAQIWQVDYRKVWGWKQGKAAPIGTQPLIEVLRCPKCSSLFKFHDHGTWLCESGNHSVKIGTDGVIELFPLY